MPQPEKKCGCSRLRATRVARSAGGDAGEQNLAGIRGAHAARIFVAIERYGVRLDVGAPERGLETLGQARRLFIKLVRCFGASDPPCAARCHAFGRIHVALYLGQRDFAFRQATVGMEDRIVRILPSLIGKTLLGGAHVLDETVAVGIAWAVDPIERRLDVRPQRGDGFGVAGALGIKAREKHEQRR